MADPPKKKPGDGKMPWGMKMGKLKPGARETITDKKLAAFVVGKQKKSRLQKVSVPVAHEERWRDAEGGSCRGYSAVLFGDKTII